MSDKPKMYRGSVKKEFTNNRSIYVSYDDKSKSEEKMVRKSYDISEIRKKISEILESPDFIYRTRVNIELADQVITKKIIGMYNDSLVTIDSEYIPISMIHNIYKV